MTDSPRPADRRKFRRSANDTRTSNDPPLLARAIVDQLFYTRGTLPEQATRNDWYIALAYAVRDRLLDKWIRTARTLIQKDVRVVAYFSAEFLVGPHLANNVVNLGIEQEVRQATSLLGLDFDQLVDEDGEPGLGNGGLGRLAACFLDSLATLEIPAIGYGIRYEFGIFDQQIRDGWQIELTDKWLASGNPWQIPRSERSCLVGFGGRTETWSDQAGRERIRWIPARVVRGMPFDTPIVGYRVNTVALLRLWRSEAAESFDFSAFNVGDYYRAVEQKVVSENLTKVLYPNDDVVMGKRLRLEQQYFFVSCSLQDMIRLHLDAGGTLETLDGGFAAQLNDTHPSIAVAELMRLLVDEHDVDWDTAWARDAAHPVLHEPYPAARSARALVVAALRRHPAAPPGDRLRDQPPVPGRRAGAESRATRGSSSGCRSSARRAAGRCGWPTSRAWGATRSTASRRSTPSC